MRISRIVDFYLGIPSVTFPYQIPNYLVPEVFQWCSDKKAGGSIEASIIPDESTFFRDVSFLFSFSKIVFNLNLTTNKNLQEQFLEYMHTNRYKFWRKKVRFNWRFMSTKMNEKLSLQSRIDNQDLISRLYHKILNLNYLFGPENWCPGQFNSLSSGHVYPLHSYLNYAYFFNEEDKNLYKLTNE